MNKKLFLMGLLAGACMFFNLDVQAQTDFMSADASSILEENALREAFSRYASLLVFFQPEEATRLGFDAGNNRLNDRTTLTDIQTLQALENIQASLKDVNVKSLPAAKRTDLHLLQAALKRHIWELQQNRLATNPLYYAQALDAIYDLMLQPKAVARKQRLDLLGRVSALPALYEQAKKNLTVASPRLAQLAMEKAYYAYLSFDSVTERITNGGEFSNDVRDSAEMDATLQKAKNALYDLFGLFKNLSQQGAEITSSLGKIAYTKKLKDYYQLDAKPSQLEARLAAYWDKAQHQLFDALRPFELSADDEEVTFVEDLNQRPQEKLPIKKNGTQQVLPYVAPTANQFYAVAGQLVSPFKTEDLLTQLSQQVNGQGNTLLQKQTLPIPLAIQLQDLIPYFTYQNAFVMYPAFSTFWVRLPQGNELAKTEALNRDFNEPATKLLISTEIVPGRFYQTQSQTDTMRRLLGTPLLANGWTLYALSVSQENQIFVTDEEMLFVAWQRFVRTIAAVVDFRLHTQQYTYAQALAFLTEQNGFTQEQAEPILNAILSQPGEAVSYVFGEALWQEAAEHELKKFKGANTTTHALLEMGNISPDDINAELKRLAHK